MAKALKPAPLKDSKFLPLVGVVLAFVAAIAAVWVVPEFRCSVLGKCETPPASETHSPPSSTNEIKNSGNITNSTLNNGSTYNTVNTPAMTATSHFRLCKGHNLAGICPPDSIKVGCEQNIDKLAAERCESFKKNIIEVHAGFSCGFELVEITCTVNLPK